MASAKNLTELRKLKSEIAQLKKKLTSLEMRKSELEALASNESINAGTARRTGKGNSSKS